MPSASTKLLFLREKQSKCLLVNIYRQVLTQGKMLSDNELQMFNAVLSAMGFSLCNPLMHKRESSRTR